MLQRRDVVQLKIAVRTQVGLIVMIGFGLAEPRGLHRESAAALPPAPSALAQRFTTDVRPFLESRCFACHGNGKHKGDVTLDQFKSFDSLKADRATWEDVQDVLREGRMPPKKAEQPSPGERERVAKWVGEALDYLDSSSPRDPGFVAIHRLNREEYNNTIRDLVGVNFNPASDFPADDSGYGFDNIADVLSMSPLLAEKYLTAAEQVMDKAIVIGNPYRNRVVRIDGDTLQGAGTSEAGARLLFTSGEVRTQHEFVASADYELRIGADADQAGREPAKMTVKFDGRELRTFDVEAVRGTPQTYSLNVHAGAGEHRVSIAFINDYYNTNAPDPKDRGDRNLYVDWVEFRGPIDAKPPGPSEIERRLLFCGPADGVEGEKCAAQIARRFASRAYRRPATDVEVARLLKVYQNARRENAAFKRSCQLMLEAALVSPQFVYRIEIDPGDHPQSPHPLTDYELATRLSYFLWSSMPDDALFAAAAAGTLHRPDALREQVARMLADARSSAFVSNFAGQWLELRNLDGVSPDPRRFPNFDRKLLVSMRREGELFFGNVLRDKRSVLELIDADYSFVDDRLARFYGIAGVTGPDFRKVTLTGDAAARRGGVLTMAGVMTVTAMPSRTSPPKRGKFVLEQILGTPPPPPPPDVPALPSKGEKASMSIRQRLEEHRSNPMCASCHARIDPIGFALENFDATGNWRDKEKTRTSEFPIDATGTLPNGEAVDGVAGLKKVILAHKEQFVRCLVEKVLTYALGRGPTPNDRPYINDISRKVQASDYRFDCLIEEIVECAPFTQRRSKAE